MLRVSFAGLVAAIAACSDGGAPPATPAAEFQVDNPIINESSGLARSHRAAELYWTHNDSGGLAETYAIDAQGRYQGSLSLSGASNIDWEDMASFVEDGAPRLLLADIGDNGAVRPFLTLYVVEEPDVAAVPRPFALSATPLRIVQVVYPDGARDAEGIAVDAVEGFIYLLSKRDAIPRLYRLPLAAQGAVMASYLGETALPRAPAGSDNPERINWVTALDIDDAAERLVAVTLSAAHVYRRAAGQTWLEVLQGPPQSLRLPDYPQIEAAAISADAQALYISSEGAPAPFARLALPQ